MPGRHQKPHRQSPTPSRHRSPENAAAGTAVENGSPFWLKSIDAGLLIAVLAVPFAFGGRHAVGESLLILGAFWAALSLVCWTLVRRDPVWIRSRSLWLVLLVPAVGLLQITPLPATVLETLSPAMNGLLPLHSSEAGAALLGERWKYLSLTAYESQVGLTLGAAYVLLFLVVLQRVRQVDDALHLLRWVALGGAAMAAFGLAQYVFSNDRYFWVLDHPQGSTLDAAKGGFLNKNHFGQFMALSIGPLVAGLTLALNDLRDLRDRRFRRVGSDFESRIHVVLQVGLFMGGLAFVMVGVLASRSRGAIAAASVAMAVLFFLLYRKKAITPRQFGSVAAAGVTSCVILTLLNSRQLTRLIDRLDFWSDNGRLPIWEANLNVFAEFPMMGTGIGSHRYVATRYLDMPYMEKQYGHAESSYLQILTETGLTGFAVTVICVMACLWWCFRGVSLARDRSASAIATCAVAASLAASMAHAVADVVWHVPGCMTVTVLLAAIAGRLYQMQLGPAPDDTGRTTWRVPRPVSLGFAAGLITLGGWMAGIWAPRLSAEPYWWEYRQIVLADDSQQGDPAEDTSTVNANVEAGTLSKTDQQATRFRRKLVALRQAARRNPADARFHVRLGIHYASLFHSLQADSENAMPLGQIRDAATSGGFESQAELREWLEAAFPENLPYADAAAAHCVAAVRRNPLEAFAYLYLAELGFLNGAPAGFEQQCIAQALELRPYNAHFLFAAGREAFLKGDVEGWRTHWKNAFHRNTLVQNQIIRQLIDFTDAPVQLVMQAFDPDIDALERLAVAADHAQRLDQRNLALSHLSQRLITRAQSPDNRDRADDWLKAAAACGQLGDTDQVTFCLLEAQKSAPSSFVVRLELGAWMIAQGRPAEAREHLQWCLRFQPDNPKVKKLLAAVYRRPRGVRQVSGQTAGRH